MKNFSVSPVFSATLMSVAMLSACSSPQETIAQEKFIVTPSYQPQTLGFNIEQMAHELVSNIQHVKPDAVIATSSFVYLDSNFDSTPLFARQVQESFTYEFHKIGQPIVEYKATGYIRVTEAGDFALSKDFKELQHSLPIDYILLGTLAKTTEGVLLNAKLVGVKSHAIVAASQRHISKTIIDQFISSVEAPAPQIKRPTGVIIHSKKPNN